MGSGVNWYCVPCTGTVLVSIRWGLHLINCTRTSCYFSWKRCWLVFSYHGEFSRFQVSKYIEYSAYTGCISLYIYCLITCNIKSLLNVPKISHISRKISQVSRFPAKYPDSRNKFVFLPKQPLLELSPPVKSTISYKPSISIHWALLISRSRQQIFSVLGRCAKYSAVVCKSEPFRYYHDIIIN